MKKFFLLTAPFLVALLTFFGILFFLEKSSAKGALKVTSVPQSKVYLDNKLVGNTTYCACEPEQMLPVGEYVLKLVPVDVNIPPFEEKIAVNKSTLTAVDRTFADSGSSEGSVISLIPIDDENDAQIFITSSPDKANVFLDSNPVGITPLLLKNIDVADHDLKVVKEGYKDKSVRIKTALGFKLSSLIYLGTNFDLVSSPAASISTIFPVASASASVLILDTPTGFLRVRESNSTASKELTRVKPGESYEFIKEEDGWFEIKISSPEAYLGWISGKYAVKK